jgi:hypothetical protein
MMLKKHKGTNSGLTEELTGARVLLAGIEVPILI